MGCWKLLSLLTCSGLTCSLSLCPPEGRQGKAASAKRPAGGLFKVPSKGLLVSKMILILTCGKMLRGGILGTNINRISS